MLEPDRNTTGYGLGKIQPHKFDWQIQPTNMQNGFLDGIINYASGTTSTLIGLTIPINTGGTE